MVSKLAGIILTIVISSSQVFAQDPEQVTAFKEAWAAYEAAVKSERSDVRIVTAQNVLRLGESLFPETDERFGVLVHNFGKALLDGGETDEARKQLEHALELKEAVHGEGSVETVPVIADLADASSGVSHERKHFALYKRALKITDTAYGEHSDEYASLALRAAMRLLDLSRSTMGEKYLKAARKYYLQQYDATDHRTGLANLYVAKMHYYRRSHKKAVNAGLEALDSFTGEADLDKAYRLRIRAFLVQSYENWGKSDLATEHCVAIGRESPFSPNQDYTPLFRQVPNYPQMLLRQGIEGHVDFEFTVDENGFVQDPVVIDTVMTGRPNRRFVSDYDMRQDDKSFEAAAREVVERFRYAPRFKDGEAIAVDGVKTRISFKLAR